MQSERGRRVKHSDDQLSQYADAGGIRTHYLHAGNGPALILLHGSGPGVSARTNWAKLFPQLAQNFSVYAPDMAGFGHTERKVDATYNIKAWVKHLLDFMNAVGIADAHLVGNSFGGSLAIAAASFAPARFGRIVLMGTPCGPFMMTPGLRAGWDYQSSLESMRAIMKLFPYDQAIVTDQMVTERYETSLIKGAQEGLRQLLAKPNEDGTPTQLSGMPETVAAKLTQPVLILHGREDRVIPVELGLRLLNAIPDAQIHIFGHCGHWVQAERPQQFLDLVIDHLQRAD
jgi:2-hydroxy-6-oxo-octa-2,4-dienoate hydrolase